MGKTPEATISHKHGDEQQIVRAINGIVVVIKNRNEIYARDARQSLKFTRPMGGMYGAYPKWKAFREKILRRKSLTTGSLMKLAAHYGLLITTARDFPDITEAKFKKEEEPDEKPNAARI